MATPLHEDHGIVIGLSVTAAMSRLQEHGMGLMEATQFLVESAARQVLGLDAAGRFFAATIDGNMTQILQEAVSAAWESGGVTDEQHDLALTYLNQGQPLAGG